MTSPLSVEWSLTTLLWLFTGLGLSGIVAIETKKLFQFWRYGIAFGPHEIPDPRVGFWRKIALLIILASLDVSEVAIGDNVSSLALMISSVIIPLTLTMTYFKVNYKLSLNNDLTSSYSTYVYPTMLLIAASLNFTEQLIWGCDWAGDLKLYFLRLIILLAFLYEPLKKLEDDEDETKEKKGILSTVRKFLLLREYFLPSSRKGQIRAVVFAILTLLGSVTNFYQDMYSMKIVDSMQLEVGDTSNTTNGSFSENIFDKLGSARLEFRWDYILIYHAICFFDSSVLWVIRDYLQRKTESESSSKLQLALFSKLQNLSLRWHLENQSSEIFGMMSWSPRIVEDIIDEIAYLIPSTIDMFVTVIYLLRFYNFKLSSVVLLTGILSSMIRFFVMRRRERAMEELRKAQEGVRTSRSATFENYETMKYFTNDEYEKQKYEKAFFEGKDKETYEFVFEHGFYSVKDLVSTGAEVIVILIVVKAVLGGVEGLTPGDYLYFSNVFRTLLNPLENYVSFYEKLQKKASTVEKLAEVLTLEPEVADDPNAPNLEIDEIGGSVEFKNVRFSYVPEREVIKDFSIFIPAGNTVAFVGRSGSGKSTLTKLLFRFYDPTAGEILVNGQNIRKVKAASVRKEISVVPQEVVLFADTIKYNIQYAKMDATDEEIEDAAKAAFLHDRIISFPDKYETEVGNRGLKLSGGEKQRVAIARAVLKNPPILILDEATSSLDTETEKQIQASLEALYKNRTTIIIAHRLSTIVNVDKIFVIDEGSIVESGSHAELLSKDGVYASMWNRQFNNIDSEPSDSGILSSETDEE